MTKLFSERAKNIFRPIWRLCLGLLMLLALVIITGQAMLAGLHAPFPFNQDDTAYLLHGQLGQILHSDQIPGRDFISYPAWGPIWILSLLSRHFEWSPEASQSVNLLLQYMILWAMVAGLLFLGLRPLLRRFEALATALIAATLWVGFGDLAEGWAMTAPELFLIGCLPVLVVLPIGLGLIRTRLWGLTGLLWFVCILWPPAMGGAVAIILLLAMILRHYRRPMRLIGAVLLGVIGTGAALWAHSDGHLPLWLGRTIALNSSLFWNLPPFDPSSRLWHFADVGHLLLTQGGLGLGALLVGLAAMIRFGHHNHHGYGGGHRGWRLLLMVHVCLLIAALMQSWLTQPQHVLWLAVQYSALACLLRAGAQGLAPLLRGHQIWITRPAVLGTGLWLGITALSILPPGFNSTIAIERGRCLFHQECGKPVADRTALLIDAQRTWFMTNGVQAEHRIISAWPIWINAMLAPKSDLPTIQALYAVRGLRLPWLDALQHRPYETAITEAPGIFPHQPWMIHQLWWFYREIAHRMTPIDSDYRHVFWLRRNQILSPTPIPAECAVMSGPEGSKIIVPVSAQYQDNNNLGGAPDMLYELHLNLDLPAQQRMLLLVDKPGLFPTTKGVSLDPTMRDIVLPLRSLTDFVILRAVADKSLPLGIQACSLTQTPAQDARKMLLGE